MRYMLDANYPNPFNPATTIRFAVPRAGLVRLAVYDVLGRRVDELVDGILDAGWHAVRWDAAGLPSGVYLYRLEAGSFQETKTMILVK